MGARRGMISVARPLINGKSAAAVAIGRPKTLGGTTGMRAAHTARRPRAARNALGSAASPVLGRRYPCVEGVGGEVEDHGATEIFDVVGRDEDAVASGFQGVGTARNNIGRVVVLKVRRTIWAHKYYGDQTMYWGKSRFTTHNLHRPYSAFVFLWPQT